MTLILKLDLDIWSRYTLIPKMNFLNEGVKKLQAEQTDTQIHRQKYRYDRKRDLPAFTGGKKLKITYNFQQDKSRYLMTSLVSLMNW